MRAKVKCRPGDSRGFLVIRERRKPPKPIQMRRLKLRPLPNPPQIVPSPRLAWRETQAKNHQRQTAATRSRAPRIGLLSQSLLLLRQTWYKRAMDPPQRRRLQPGRCTILPISASSITTPAWPSRQPRQPSQCVRRRQSVGEARLYRHPGTRAVRSTSIPPAKPSPPPPARREDSPGFSTIESEHNQITTRRVLLRADHPQMLTAVLPHEITHIVLADLFSDQQIPRWADEGIAVLSEPTAEQNLRAADLNDSLSAGRIFELRQLMSTDTPDAKDWSLYYAQSVSLARFLVEQGTPEQMIQFVRESGRKGIEPALREIYGLGGFAELDRALASIRTPAARYGEIGPHPLPS